MVKIEDKLFKDFTQFKVSRLGILERRRSRGECSNSILIQSCRSDYACRKSQKP